MTIIPNLKLIRTKNSLWQIIFTPVLPCPFCGGKAQYIQNDPSKFIIRTFCHDCGISTPFLYDNDAIATWNRRNLTLPLDIDVSGSILQIPQKGKDAGTVAKLENCPFCGGEADLRGSGMEFYIVCNKCLVYTPYMEKDKAIVAWNKRYSERK